ncbi:hypothetical protein QWY90_03325 [Flavobacterium paronense]|nr:hypothetical protein [Flavobacterium paronense]MDN3676339.1 hypothetical protein [Flavobacterium paronense]
MTRFFYLFIIISISSFAQQKANEDELAYREIQTLERAITIADLENNQNESDVARNEFSKETLRKIRLEILRISDAIIEYFPKSEYLYETLFEKAITEELLGDIDAAEKSYKKVVSFDTAKTDLKNVSLKNLARISIQKKKYKQALNYLEQLKNFKISHGCGNGEDAYKEILDEMYKQCYEGLKK